MPGAQCTRSLVCALVLEYAHEYSQRRHRKHPAFPTQWFYGLYVISPGTGLSCPRRPRDKPATLTPASGRQDHTPSPSASSAFVSRAISVHRIPLPTSVTIAIRPSCGGGTAGEYTFSDFPKEKYFGAAN
jgi:hypothetical protein